jgi:hypothetical protein
VTISRLTPNIDQVELAMISKFLFEFNMGNKATGPFREAYNPSLQGWQLHRRTEDYNVWQNPSTGEELEEYRFVINDVKEFQHEKEIFEFRYDSSTLVSSRYFREDTQR